MGHQVTQAQAIVIAERQTVGHQVTQAQAIVIVERQTVGHQIMILIKKNKQMNR